MKPFETKVPDARHGPKGFGIFSTGFWCCFGVIF